MTRQNKSPVVIGGAFAKTIEGISNGFRPNYTMLGKFKQGVYANSYICLAPVRLCYYLGNKQWLDSLTTQFNKWLNRLTIVVKNSQNLPLTLYKNLTFAFNKGKLHDNYFLKRLSAPVRLAVFLRLIYFNTWQQNTSLWQVGECRIFNTHPSTLEDSSRPATLLTTGVVILTKSKGGQS